VSKGVIDRRPGHLISSHFAHRSPKAIHLGPGEHGEIGGRLEVGWEKVACWSTKAAINISEMRKDRGKVTMEGL